jgi:hypothetical protein
MIDQEHFWNTCIVTSPAPFLTSNSKTLLPWALHQGHKTKTETIYYVFASPNQYLTGTEGCFYWHIPLSTTLE